MLDTKSTTFPQTTAAPIQSSMRRRHSSVSPFLFWTASQDTPALRESVGHFAGSQGTKKKKAALSRGHDVLQGVSVIRLLGCGGVGGWGEGGRLDIALLFYSFVCILIKDQMQLHLKMSITTSNRD